MAQPAPEHQIFKAMSNRTRFQPHDIYKKLSGHLGKLQDQVKEFNKGGSKETRRIKVESHRPGRDQRALNLKHMSKPKYQELLVHFELPAADGSQKQGKLAKKGSRNGQVSSGLIASNRNFSQMDSYKGNRGPNGREKAWSHNNGPIESNQSIVNMEGCQFQTEEMNLPVTNSVMMTPLQEYRLKMSRMYPEVETRPSTKRLLTRKQRLLQSEWEKTERYHEQISVCIGKDDHLNYLKTIPVVPKLNTVMNKVSKTRPASSAENRGTRFRRITSTGL